MKVVTKYQADDGKEFNTEAEALHYERAEALADGITEAGLAEGFEFCGRRAADWLLANYKIERITGESMP